MPVSIAIEVDGRIAPIDVEGGYVAIRESMDFFVPTATLVFTDRLSSFVATYPFMQDTKVRLSLQDLNQSRKWDFRAFSSRKQKNNAGGVETFQTKLDLIATSGEKLLLESEFHSDTNTISNYVRYIAGKCGLKTEIEDTKEVLNIINPNWTYAQMIRWCAINAVSAAGSVGYVYYVKPNGTLVFKSPDSLFENNTDIEMTLGSYTVLDDNGNDEAFINKAFTLNENLYANVLLGANKSILAYKELSTGETINKTIENKDGLRKRGSVLGVSTELQDKSKSNVFNPRYDSIHSEINRTHYNKVWRQLETIQLSFAIPYDEKVEVGSVLNLTIPSNPDLIQGGVNMNYSGRYLVKSVATVGHGDYYKKLHVVRPGLNLDKDRKQLYI